VLEKGNKVSVAETNGKEPSLEMFEECTDFLFHLWPIVGSFTSAHVNSLDLKWWHGKDITLIIVSANQIFWYCLFHATS
jgi:hypothetical protein